MREKDPEGKASDFIQNNLYELSKDDTLIVGD